MIAGRKTEDGNIIYAPPLKWISTPEFLATQDKFLDDGVRKAVKTEKVKRTVGNHNEVKEFGVGSDDNLKSGSASVEALAKGDENKVADAAISATLLGSSSEEERRPMGIKRSKIEVNVSRAAKDANKSLTGIRQGIAEGNRLILEEHNAQRAEREDSRDIELLKLLYRSSPEFKEIMDKMLERRRKSRDD